MRHTEHVHILLGIGLVLTGALWIGAQVGTWDTFLSVFPNSLSVWLMTVQKFHVVQHTITSVCAMAAGAIEESGACGVLAAGRWPDALPILTVGAGLAIGIHGGTHQPPRHLVEQVHHWVLGAALVLSGLVQTVAISRQPERQAWRHVLPALVLVAGLDLAFLHRLR